MEVMNLYLTLRYLRDEYKANPSEELKEQILLTDKKLRDLENRLSIIYTLDKMILTERGHQTFLDAINNLPEPNEELINLNKEYKEFLQGTKKIEKGTKIKRKKY